MGGAAVSFPFFRWLTPDPVSFEGRLWIQNLFFSKVYYGSRFLSRIDFGSVLGCRIRICNPEFVDAAAGGDECHGAGVRPVEPGGGYHTQGKGRHPQTHHTH